jgi:hypothetical protein
MNYDDYEGWDLEQRHDLFELSFSHYDYVQGEDGAYMGNSVNTSYTPARLSGMCKFSAGYNGVASHYASYFASLMLAGASGPCLGMPRCR